MAANDHRIETLEAKLEAQRAARDEQLSAIATDNAALAEATRSVQSSLAGIESRLRAIEQRPQPGVLAFWAPALATATILGGLGQFILAQQQRVTEVQITDLQRERDHDRDLAERMRNTVGIEAINQADSNGYQRGRNETQDRRLERLEDKK